MTKKLTIGITINNILRDHITKLSEAYLLLTGEYPLYPINPFVLEDSFITRKTTKIENEFNPDVTDTDLSENPPEEEEFEVYDFMYNEAAFEVFGRADEAVSGIIFKLSQYAKDNNIDIVLMNKEAPKSKCGTLLFLSRNNFNSTKLIFPDTYEEFWNYCDILVTDNPHILDCKPKRFLWGKKKSIKVSNDFNLDSKSDYTIFDISELFSIIEFNKIIK